MSTKSNILTLSVTKTGISVCSSAKNEVLQMPFDTGTLVNMEIVDLPKLSTKISAFINQHQIKPSEVVMIIDSDICFVKEIVAENENQIAEKVQEFLDCVPVSSPSYKLFQVGNARLLIVINRRFYEAIRQAFESIGFNVTAVVPEAILSPLGVATALDNNSCLILTKNMAFIRQNSFIFPPVVDLSPSWVKKHGKLAVLFSVMGICLALGAIGFVFWQIQNSRLQAVARARARAATMSKAAVPVPSPTPSPTPEILASQLTIKVFNASTIKGAAAKMSLELASNGFAKAEVGDAPVSGTTAVVFSPRVPLDLRTQIIETVDKLHFKPSTIENSQSQFDVVITLGKITP